MRVCPVRLLRIVAGVFVILLCGSRTASAQIDFSGIWAPIMHEDSIERAAGPDLGDYLGLPINDAGRLRGETWDASILTMEEHTCKPHPSTYGFRGVGNLWMTTTIDPTTFAVTSINTHIQWMEQKRVIWMDGRPHPPEFAPHTWQGFSTGRWEGNVLVVETTHLKAGWIRRNGLALSDRAHMTERFIRHGDLLTHVYIIEDPVYLSEPLIKTNGFRLTGDTTMAPYPCQPAVEVERPPGEVPNYLPGQNPYLTEFATKFKLPVEATRGGAATALPEFSKRVAGITSSGAGASAATSTRGAPAAASKPAAVVASSDVRSWHVQGNVWMINADTVNVAVQVGDDGVLVVDTGTAALADRILAEIQRLAQGKPIRYIVNTSAHPDHTGGNVTIAKAGRSIISGNFVGQVVPDAANAAKIVAHENTLRRLSLDEGTQPVAPAAAWPTDTFFTSRNDLFFNGEAVQMLYQPHAHSDNDVLVYFRKSDVIVTGEVYINTTFPVIDRSQGGSLEGIVAALGRIIELTVPRDKQEGGTYVIPGHGRIADEADVVEYFDMMAILRDRLQDAVKKGMSLAQVKAAGLARDYEGRYGAAEGASTTDAFIEAAYRSLSPTPAAQKAR
jgi:glyoxylase-like metal-dependent hydrolase (beta-lactamase superfamily II)